MKKGILLVTAFILVVGFSACDSPIGAGAGYGAAGGAIIGGLAGDSVRSAAIGSAAGAGLGALVGAIVQQSERERYYAQRPPGGYPYGRPTEYRGIVRVPRRVFQRLLPERPTHHGASRPTASSDPVREHRREEAAPAPVDRGRECGDQRAGCALNV